MSIGMHINNTVISDIFHTQILSNKSKHISKTYGTETDDLFLQIMYHQKIDSDNILTESSALKKCISNEPFPVFHLKEFSYGFKAEFVQIR